ncbi:MAG: hypothetical protein ABSB59_44510, partial [Streptosporangiaceae bacterium]
LRLHPGKGFAHVFGLWLRWGRLAVLRRSARIRRGLPLWYRIAEPRQHSVFAGRAHYRHALRVPLIGNQRYQDLLNVRRDSCAA